MRTYSEMDAAATADAIAAAQRGELVVVNGDSGYVVITDAFSARGVERLRALKARPDMNVPVFVGRVETVAGISPVAGVARELMTAFWPGALTIIAAAQRSLAWDCTPNGTVAIRMPAHPWTLEVVRGIGPTAVVPVDAVPVTSVDAARALLGDAVAVYLDGGPCSGSASAVVDATEEQPVLVRSGAISEAELRAVAPELGA